jgi:hypothetical protein
MHSRTLQLGRCLPTLQWAGVWFHEQQRLNTKESKRGKLLKSIYKTNAAALESKQQQPQPVMALTTLAHYLALDSLKSVHVSKGLQGHLFSAYNQQLKPTRKRYATRKLSAMPLPAIPECPQCQAADTTVMV